eukprot:TRINITY_DN23800_c0_g3_i1.p1 TRINITY_DN23800_c0_g3~~TRINITY_DN23800_c0_g3_i1.p1  ORF type:complete len:723 (+),score=185.18 TRINITY_DN23800_c0_g3_i1:78-2246(+)
MVLEGCSALPPDFHWRRQGKRQGRFARFIGDGDTAPEQRTREFIWPDDTRKTPCERQRKRSRVSAAVAAAVADASTATTALSASGGLVAGLAPHAARRLAASSFNSVGTAGTDYAHDASEALKGAENSVYDMEVKAEKAAEQEVHELRHDFDELTHGKAPTPHLKDFLFRMAVTLIPAGAAGYYLTRGGGDEEDPLTGYRPPLLQPQQRADTEAVAESAAAAAEPEEEDPETAGALRRAREAESRAQDVFQEFYARATPYVKQGVELQEMVERRAKSVHDKGKNLLETEVNDAVAEVKERLTKDLPIADLNQFAKLPNTPMLLAGACAPGQLRMLHAENIGRMAYGILVLSVDLLSLALSWGTSCPTHWWFGLVFNFLPDWMGVDAAMLLFEQMTRFNAYREVSATLEQLETANEMTEDELVFHRSLSPDDQYRNLLNRHLLIGARAMLKYDQLKKSRALGMLPYVSAFDFVWQMFGWTGIFDTPVYSCGSLLLLRWARTRGCLFLLLFLPNALNLGFQLLRMLTENKGFALSVLRTAQDIDENLSPDFPICTLMVRAFLVRDTDDMAGMQLLVLQSEENLARAQCARVRVEKEKMDAELDKVERKVEASNARTQQQLERVAARSQDQRFLEMYAEAVNDAMVLQQNVAAMAAAAQGDPSQLGAVLAAAGQGAAGSSAAGAAPGAQDTGGQQVPSDGESGDDSSDESSEGTVRAEATGGTGL